MIIYIHGFNSAGNGSKYKIICDMFPMIKTISPTYDCKDFNSIENILEGVNLDDNLLFIGNSLGGYISMYLAKKYNGKAILLNPLTNPSQLERFLGFNTNFSTSERYELTKENIDILDKYRINYTNIPVTIYVTKDDDIINYRDTIKYFKNRNVNVLEQGTHRFECLSDINDDIIREYFNITL